MDKNKDGKWITVMGRRVFIEGSDGKSELSNAIASAKSKAHIKSKAKSVAEKISGDSKISSSAKIQRIADKVSIKQQVAQNKALIDKTESIGLTVDYESPLSERVRKVKANLQKTGGIVTRPDIGKVQVGNKIKEGLKYYRTDKPENKATQIAISAVPDVIAKGVIINKKADHKGRQYSTLTIANKVYVDGKDGVMAVVIMQTPNNAYKVHRVLTPDGKDLILDK